MNQTPDFFAHPTAVVDDGARIGKGTKIWHFCHIFANATIGERCVVGQGCSIASKAVIGNNCKLQNGISVYDCVVLEDDVFCGPHMVFTNVFNPRAFVERKEEYRPTRLCRGCTIGANAVVVCGVTIGAYAMVGAGSVVTRDVPDYALVFGNPARHRGWVDRRGEKLDFSQGNTVCGSDGLSYQFDTDRQQVQVVA